MPIHTADPGRRWSAIAAWVAALLVIAATAHAGPLQAATAVVRGVVRDPSGAVLAGAAVSVTNVDTGSARTTRSAPDGSFQVASLTPGRYRVAISRDRFAPTHQDIELSADQVLQLSVTLALAPQAQEDITVVAGERSTIDVTRTAIGRTISGREIEELAISTAMNREFMMLATLTPGVVPVPEASVPNAFATSGQGHANNAILIDGVSVDSPAGGGGMLGVPPSDAIREFRVVSNHFSAEFGQASGAVVNLVSRSGTNTMAGRVFGFYQAEGWNARSPTAQLANAPDPDFRQHNAGASLGGRLIRDRAFFFGSIEGAVKSTAYINTSPVSALFRPGEPLTIPYRIESVRGFARGDTHVTPANTLTVRYGYQLDDQDQVGREEQSAAERGRSTSGGGFNLAVFDTQVFGTAVVNEFRAQHVRYQLTQSVDCPGCAALNYAHIKLGKPANAPLDNRSRRWELGNTLTWLAAGRTGRHMLKTGIGFSHMRLDNINPQNFVGTYTFRHDKPFDPLDKTTYPFQFTQNTGNAERRTRETIVSLFVQDEWQPHAAWSINAGVRWDHTDWPAASGQRSRRDDLAPRLGIAFDPSQRGTTAIRAGFGRYYDETLLGLANTAESNFVQLTIRDPGFRGDARDFDPYGFNPNRFGQATPVPRFNANRYGAVQTPYTDQASAGIQHRFGASVDLTVDVVRVRGNRLPIRIDVNYPDPVTHARPDPAFNQIFANETRAESWYTGLHAGLQTRRIRGQVYTVAYTWSSAENNTAGVNVSPKDQANLQAERGPALTDARHRLIATGNVMLPFGLSWATVVSARSGLPYSVTTGADDNGDGDLTNDWPADRGRNGGRGGAFFQADMRVSKFMHYGSRRIELLVDITNVTNRATNFTSYNGQELRDQQTGTLSPLFGLPTAAGPGRQVQAGCRFIF